MCAAEDARKAEDVIVMRNYVLCFVPGLVSPRVIKFPIWIHSKYTLAINFHILFPRERISKLRPTWELKIYWTLLRHFFHFFHSHRLFTIHYSGSVTFRVSESKKLIFPCLPPFYSIINLFFCIGVLHNFVKLGLVKSRITIKSEKCGWLE